MIGKVTKGNGVRKLLWYLYGPGRTNEHTDPHLVAAWSDDLQALEPAFRGGRHDVRPLADLLDQPLAALVRQPSTSVWHCSLRLAPEDRQLSNAEWDHVARTVLDRVGLAPRDDADGCRWVAVRHAEDHIHLAVTLARQDGQPARTRNDFYAVGAACRDLEVHYDLRRTAPRDRTGPRLPTRAETEKHQRAGRRETSRDFLRREVRLAAVAADGPADFFDRLRRVGLLVRPRYSTQDPGQVTGYSVARPGDHNSSGAPVWFGGSKLAADLSLSRLEQRWTKPPGVRRTAKGITTDFSNEDFERHVVALRSTIRRLRAGHYAPNDIQHIRRSAITLALVLARSLEGIRGGPLTQRADHLDRVSRASRRPKAARHDHVIVAARALIRNPISRANDLTSIVVEVLDTVEHLVDTRKKFDGNNQRHLTSSLQDKNATRARRNSFLGEKGHKISSIGK
ncbi:hypothetical protein MO973_09685 [Paenibacillus sp. TRM 82003]|uniref:hypothetical protein n=1 Tax=Kineococcus sp. TRM81007 TaxID=2925831 RepID=UPI001F589167|nr:hypothetical protein [Kineococcus sp. TRM81007]MCI2238118.1 hypothetical protein [Kineococcus sp. TRM81007]MCI3920502.1 hypothetical protein [Paenibacillus sp. TRM 82003]